MGDKWRIKKVWQNREWQYRPQSRLFGLSWLPFCGYETVIEPHSPVQFETEQAAREWIALGKAKRFKHPVEIIPVHDA